MTNIGTVGTCAHNVLSALLEHMFNLVNIITIHSPLKLNIDIKTIDVAEALLHKPPENVRRI